MRNVILCFAVAVLPFQLVAQDRVFVFEGAVINAPTVSGLATTDTEEILANPDPGVLWWDILPIPLAGMPDVPTSFGAREHVYAIEARERSDEPCDIRIRYRNVNGDIAVNLPGRFSDCSNNSNNKNGTDGSEEEITMAAGQVPTGIQICLNGDKMKGMTMTGSLAFCMTSVGADLDFCTQQFDNTARDPRRDPPNFFERANCPGSNSHKVDGDWTTEASVCPNVDIDLPGNRTANVPTAMVGMELHLTSTNNGKRRYVSGIRALCKRMAIEGGGFGNN